MLYSHNDVDIIFTCVKDRINTLIQNYLPEAWIRFSSIFDNLISENIETRSNTVNSCRRILQDLADLVYLPSKDEIIFGREVPLGKANYKNRIMAFLNLTKTHNTAVRLIRSNIDLYWKKLDAVYEGTNKGSHDFIITRQEAELYILNTYLFTGEILTLWHIHNNPDANLVKGLENYIYYFHDRHKKCLSVSFMENNPAFRFEVNAAGQGKTTFKLLQMKGSELEHYDISGILPSEITGFDEGNYSNTYLQIGAYRISKQNDPFLIIALGGESLIRLVIIKYDSQLFEKNNMIPFKIIGDLSGQFNAIILNDKIYLPFGSVGFAQEYQYDGYRYIKKDEVLLNPEFVFKQEE